MTTLVGVKSSWLFGLAKGARIDRVNITKLLRGKAVARAARARIAHGAQRVG